MFRRRDLNGAPTVRATYANGQETPLCTTVAAGEVKVATIEHLMSALAACGVDNAEIELDGPEVPIMDGSAAPFVFLVECAGIEVQEAPRWAICILKTVEIDEGGRHASLSPARRFWIDFEIDFDSEVVSRQAWSGGINNQQFKSDLARARTFGFLQEVDHLRRNGLARGGSLDNAVVIDGNGVMNEGGLRFEDEFVRHKVLDSIGDLYLAGAPILGRFTGHKTGHAMNLRLLRALFADESAWCWVDLARADRAPGASVPPARAVAARTPDTVAGQAPPPPAARGRRWRRDRGEWGSPVRRLRRTGLLPIVPRVRCGASEPDLGPHGAGGPCPSLDSKAMDSS